MGAGRPRILNPLGKRFQALYFNPFLNPVQICQTMNLAQSTFYKYVNELAAPEVRVALGGFSHLPGQKAFANQNTFIERYDAEILQQLGPLMKTRLKLVPASYDRFEAVQLVRSGRVDLGISNVSSTPLRRAKVAFSAPYVFHTPPYSCLFRHRLLGTQLLPDRPRVAVQINSIHWEFAVAELAHEFDLIAVSSLQNGIRALGERRADYLLTLPESLSPAEASELVLDEDAKVYRYRDSFTGLFAANGNEALLASVNRALEVLFENKAFPSLLARATRVPTAQERAHEQSC